MRKITEIIVHCSATPEGRDVHAADIDRYHRSRGFNCIGYHYVITLDGTVEAGRPERSPGAHCLGHNGKSLGICYIGGMNADYTRPKDTRTEAQKTALRELLVSLRAKYPEAVIRGHREFALKACPCFDVRAEYGDI